VYDTNIAIILNKKSVLFTSCTTRSHPALKIIGKGKSLWDVSVWLQIN